MLKRTAPKRASRTSTIEQTIMDAPKVLKPRKKIRKTKAMTETLKDAGKKVPKSKVRKSKTSKKAGTARKASKKGKKVIAKKKK